MANETAMGKPRRTGSILAPATSTPTAADAELAIIELFRNGYATDEQWEDMAAIIRAVSSANASVDSVVDGIMDTPTASGFKGGGRLYSAGA